MSGTGPYDDLIMDHIKNARNYFVLDNVNGKATGSNPLCGDDLTVYLKVDRDRIAEITFQCTCCGMPAMIMRATQKKMMSGPVTRSVVG